MDVNSWKSLLESEILVKFSFFFVGSFKHIDILSASGKDYKENHIKFEISGLCNDLESMNASKNLEMQSLHR